MTSPSREDRDTLLKARQVPEWVAAHPDQAIPPRVKLRIWTRCDGKCAITGRKLRPGDAYQFDHIVALVNGGAHREANLQVISGEAHKVKTRADVAEKSKVARVKAKHLGFHERGKGFRRHPTLKRGVDGKVRPRDVKDRGAFDADFAPENT